MSGNSNLARRPVARADEYTRAVAQTLLELLAENHGAENIRIACAELVARFQARCQKTPLRGVSREEIASATRFGVALRGIVPPTAFRRRQFLVDRRNINHYMFMELDQIQLELEKFLAEGTVQERARNADGRRITILEQRVADLLARVCELEARTLTPTPNPQK